MLDRTTRSTALTQVGREFLPLARRLVDNLTHGIERLRTTSRLALGDVTVATLQSVAFRQLPLVLERYAHSHPGNRVQVLERSGSLVTKAVREGEADFGIHIQGDQDPDLVEDRLMRDPFVLICAGDHPMASRSSVSWRDLAGVDLVTLGGASGNRRLVEAQLTRAGLSERGRFVVESTPTAPAFASAGVGAAILPAAMRAASVAIGLVEVPLVEPTLYRSIGLVRRRNETLTPAAGAFYLMIKSTLAAAPKKQWERRERAPHRFREAPLLGYGRAKVQTLAACPKADIRRVAGPVDIGHAVELLFAKRAPEN